MTAGTMVRRTTKASRRTPSASAKAIAWLVGLLASAPLPNTAIMMTAAATTTPVPWVSPERMAAAGVAPRTCCSWIPETRNIS